ncbi:MAG: hypothetical protein IJ083_05160, partial [Clostridia bacterium]|nr:hypothetical protein [Clostridia bacterium]
DIHFLCQIILRQPFGSARIPDLLSDTCHTVFFSLAQSACLLYSGSRFPQEMRDEHVIECPRLFLYNHCQQMQRDISVP